MDSRRLAIVLAVLTTLVGCASRPAIEEAPAPVQVRVALFNIRELSRAKVDTQPTGTHAQLRAAANVIQRVRPDVMVIQEVDHHSDDLLAVASDFATRYLATGDRPLVYSYHFAAPNNTGRPSGLDLDGNGRVMRELGSRGYGGDCWGFGTYPGQYSMVVMSRYPFDVDGVRTFQHFEWSKLPGHHMPSEFAPNVRYAMRLSSKSHWDVPVRVEGHELRLLVSHPTPPVFDGPEDRNGRRNFDEIKFWAEYLNGSEAIVDDLGYAGGYPSNAPFMVVGDLNARPESDESNYDGKCAIDQLLTHPRVVDPRPTGGGLESNAHATADFGGGVRVDYVLPSVGLEVVDSGVFWPDAMSDAEGNAWAKEASDHRLVWVDVRMGTRAAAE